MKFILILGTISCGFGFDVHKFQRPRRGTPTRPTTHLGVTMATFSDVFPSIPSTKGSKTTVELFFEALNDKNVDLAMSLVDDEIEFEDANFPSVFKGKSELERNLRSTSQGTEESIIVDKVVADKSNNKIGILFHVENPSGDFGKKGTAYFGLDGETGLIKKSFVVKESNKSGEANLKILTTASKIIEKINSKSTKTAGTENEETVLIDKKSGGMEWISSALLMNQAASPGELVERYFEAWNQRDMTQACSVFAEEVRYDDTAFPAPFAGKEALENHLNICSEAFPPTFSFVIDDVVDGKNAALVKWHVENDGETMPFTRGCSFFEAESGKIIRGTDVVEPAVFKSGGLNVSVQSIPVRLVPLAVWFVYMYVVFFSDWFYGLPATSLEQRTWEEVRDLSLNFFFVSPILNLPFAPVVHPMLEGVFNLLLSWAALFAGFLSDERDDKPNLLPMLPMVAGMQFLTSAFLLPYLVTRSEEPTYQVYQEDLPKPAQVTESKLLPIILSTVGTGSIVWAVFARMEDFGGLEQRIPSFLELLSIDRVGSSFLVDLAIFAIFQGWLVDDDLKRRGTPSGWLLPGIAKNVPFFGMAAYLLLRPSLPRREDKGV